MKSNEIPVFFAVDDNYVQFLAVALDSLITNVSQGRILKIHILTERLSEENRAGITAVGSGRADLSFVNVSDKVAAFSDSLHMRDYYTRATYYRLFIASLFPQYDRCVYLDSDILVRGDIANLYDCSGGDELLCAVPDDIVTDNEVFSRYTQTVLGIPAREYFNAGVLVMNLANLRAFGIEQKFARLISRVRFPVAQDQDYLNVLCRGRICWVGHRWNQTAFTGIAFEDDPSLVHFKMSFKPWRYVDVPFSEEFWHFADRTPFGGKLHNMLASYGDADKAKDIRDGESLLALAVQETKKAERAAQNDRI